VRFRNTNPSPLTVRDAGLTVGPFGEFDFPGYDPAVHGVIPGCEPVDAPYLRDAACTRMLPRGHRQASRSHRVAVHERN
jgi:hypothetical protein